MARAKDMRNPNTVSIVFCRQQNPLAAVDGATVANVILTIDNDKRRGAKMAEVLLRDLFISGRSNCLAEIVTVGMLDIILKGLPHGIDVIFDIKYVFAAIT